MKKQLFVLILALASASCCADIPSWLKKPEKEYPASQYIRASGEGKTEKNAKNAALAEISLYFDTKTEIVSFAIKESSALIAEDAAIFSSSSSYTQIATITSEAEFFCVSFTDPYYDKKAKTYSVLAYINKKDAAQQYTARIAALIQAVKAYKNQAQKTTEPFMAAQSLRKAMTLANIAERYIKIETMIVPSDTAKYNDALETFARLPAERDALKKQMTFSIILNQKDARYNPLFSTVSAILERDGYAYSVSGATYKIIIDVSCTEEEYNTGPFVRPSVDVLIVNEAGEGIYTYSKAYTRTGAKTMDAAYTRAVVKIQKDLEEHFLAE